MCGKLSIFQRGLDRIVTLLRRVRLQLRLFICFLCVSLLPVVLYSCYAYRVYTGSIRAKVGEYAVQSAKLLDRNLQLELEKYGYYINALSVMPEVQQLLRSGDADSALTDQLHKLTRELKSAAPAGPYLRETQIVHVDGALRYSSGYDSVSNTLYRALLPQIDAASPRDSLQYTLSRHTASGTLVLGRKIYRYTTAMEPIGYILLYINARPLEEEILSGIDFGPDSAVFLMGADGTVLISNSEDYCPGSDLRDSAFHAQLAESQAEGRDTFLLRQDSGSYLMTFHYDQAYQCYFVVTVPEGYIRNETHRITAHLLGLAALLFAVSFTAALLVYSSIVLPLRHIVDCCNILSDEEVDKYIGDTSPDEVGFLARTLDNLIRELKEMYRQWQKDQVRKRELELDSLRYQINPHFLFNTLNSLRWLASLNDVPILCEGIDSLSALLKSTLIQKDEFLPLQEEARNLDHYFSIQKIRYGDKFDVHYEMEPELQSYGVPRFILQPLAENAVLHGMDGGHIMQIVIRAETRADGVYIGVLDDGKGFDAPAQKERFSGIGLSNVAERLRLYYGESYGLTVESRKGHGTRCWLHLPPATLKGGEDGC